MLSHTRQSDSVIVVRADEAGGLVIDCSGEPRFSMVKDGSEVGTGLFVRGIDGRQILVDDGGQPGPVLSYVKDWFAERGYRIRLDAALERRIRGYEDERRLVAGIRKRSVKWPVPRFSTPFLLRRRLLKHQVGAVKHALAVRHAANFSVPGSGKTAAALAVYAALRHGKLVDGIAVIGPASSFVPWEEEFQLLFGREPKSLRLVGTSQQRAESLTEASAFDLILCTYQMAYREVENLRRALQQARYLLVLDESHNIKNIELGPWPRTVIALAPFAERRMILTGTPAPHSLLDLWSQFTFLWPSEVVLRDRLGYEQRVAQPRRVVEQLKRELKPFFVRAKKSDLKLPRPVTRFYKIQYGKIPKRQRVIIRLLELATLQEARELGLGKMDLGTLRRWRRARTIRLMQASSNPALLRGTAQDLGDPGDPLELPALASLLRDYAGSEVPAKIQWVVELVRRLVAGRRKVVVWAHFVDNLLLLRSLLSDLNPLLAYGAIAPYEDETDPEFENRERNIREFKSNDDRFVLIANPSACAESISLHTVCQDAVYLERTFNCGQFLQSMDRIHRVGMPRDARATYHIPLIPSAIEQAVNRRLKQRQETLYRLLDDDMPVMGYEDDSTLLDREDDLEMVFTELLQEIAKSAGRDTQEPSARRRPRRRSS